MVRLMTNDRLNPEYIRSRHSERCSKCKEIIPVILKKIYGAVEISYNLQVGTRPEDFREFSCASELREIFYSLQNHRGYTDFVRARKLPRCDFFVPNPGFIVEFDESQHFTAPRKLSLLHYPDSLRLGFPRDKWIHLCDKIQAKDNDPRFRDEQRAWYDTLRDFLPSMIGLLPTIRLYSRDYVWCQLNPDNCSDVERFRSLIEE